MDSSVRYITNEEGERIGVLLDLEEYRLPPLRWTPPKQRGRPPRALQRLVERWCS